LTFYPDDDELDEETAREIFDELRGKKAKLSVVDFLQWGDIQDLLESGALSSDNLANCIEKVGVVVDKSGRANQDLDFQTFSDLIALIDNYIDDSKIVSDGMY